MTIPTGMYWVYLNAVFFALKAHTKPRQEACTAWACGVVASGPTVVHQPQGLQCRVSRLLEGPLGIQIYSLSTWHKAPQTHTAHTQVQDTHALSKTKQKPSNGEN